MEKTREHQVEVEPRFTLKRKNCKIKERDSDSEGVLGGTTASSRHCVEVRVRARQVEEMHRKDICNSEELKNEQQKQSPYQKGMDQTLNAKMMDENNGTVSEKHGPDAERKDDGREQRKFSNTTMGSTNSGQLLQQEQICNMRGWPRR